MYADATLQRLPSVVARAGRASWRWEIPARVKTGSATAAVSCGKAGKSSRAFTVAGPPSAPARVVVLKNGFSQRVVYTTRRVSFGAELSNPSPENDALGIDVQVNFIDATNRGRPDGASLPSLRSARAPSTTWAARRTSPTQPQSRSSRIVTRIGGQQPKKRLGPASSDILVQAQVYEPAWTATVVGQVTNDHPTMLLRSTQISAVVYDSAGNIIGGAQGGTYGVMLPGVRSYFQASSGADAIPYDRVAAANVSVLGTYEGQT